MSQRRTRVVGLGVRVGGRLFPRRAHRPYVVVAGTTGAGDDIAAQTREALRRIEIALREAGASLSDVVRTRMYRHRHLAVARRSARCTRKCSATIRPVTTMVEVSALISPDLLVEIEVDAYLAGLSASGANRPFASGRYGVTLITAAAGNGPYRCGNTIESGSVARRVPSGSARSAVRHRCAAAPDRCGRRTAGWPAGAPAQGVERCTNPSASSESGRCSPQVCAPLPVVGAAEVDQHARRRIHTASLPCPQHRRNA